MRKNLPKTLDQLIFCKYTLVFSRFTKYLVNSYQQRGVKHYILIPNDINLVNFFSQCRLENCPGDNTVKLTAR